MIETDLGATCLNPEALHNACRYRQPDWLPGASEPWITDLIASLLLASGQTQVLEIGGFHGHTSRALLDTLDLMGGGHLTVVDIDKAMCQRIIQRLRGAKPGPTTFNVEHQDSLDYIPSIPDNSLGFVFLDGNHQSDQVNEEIIALRPKIKDGGILTFHDVIGNLHLHHLVEYYGGIALDLPRVSSSGGLGILQLTPTLRLIPPAHVKVTPIPDAPDDLRLVQITKGS